VASPARLDTRAVARAGLIALGLVGIAGFQLGGDLRGADARCLSDATRARRWTVRVRADATPGAFVRAEGVDVPCRLDAWLAVRSGRASAGSVVAVTGAKPSAGDGGLLLRDARLTLIRGPGPLDRWRNATARALDRRFGADAPMVRALLIADTRGLNGDLRDRYADAGLVHLLSISGLHVAIVGGALLLLFQAVRFSSSAAACAAVACTLLYVCAIGAPPPAARSVTLFAATTLTRLLQRPVSPWGAFALGALAPLAAPRTVLDLGWQLSVAGYAAIVVSGRMGRRRLPRRWRGWRRTLARELLTGSLATVATAPLVTWHFGRLSLVAPVSNLAAGPVVSLLQPTLFLAMLAPVAAGADFAADAARPLLRTLDAVAATAAAIPGAAVGVAPTAFAAALAGIAAAAVLVAGWARHWRPPLVVAAGAIALLAWMPSPPTLRRAGVELHLLDVGQGDAIALRSPRGRWVVIDAGRQWSAGDAGRATVIPYLRRRGGEVALLVITHPHADHIGGAASVVRALRPREMRDAAFVERSTIYREVLAEAAARGVRWQRVRPGEVRDVDGMMVEFLAPDSAWTVALRDPNEASAVVRVRYGDVQLLLTGDAERGEEAWLLARAGTALGADVLKVGHHGSSTSSTAAFVRAVSPRLALVSVGATNLYGHPSSEVMQRLAEAGATVLRTDQLGTIIVRTDGAALEVEAAGVRWSVARPLPAMR
jgi:competence protein ComEC